jgi:cytochrome c biogenesis protein CcmG, thiol:disulfide interchange protein DsbE
MKQLLLVGLVAVVGGCASALPQKPVPGEAIDFALPVWASSQPHPFTDDVGHIVVLDAWASWCEPCKAELPQLDKLAKQWAPQGVRVYAASIDTDPEAVQPYLMTMHIDLPILLDPGGVLLTRMLGLQNMPTTWVFDKAGHLVFTQQGNAAGIAEKVNAMLSRPDAL